jgi:hypothetical protein
MSAWENAVNKNFAKNIKAIAEYYASEEDLLNNLEDFGGKVWDVLLDTETLTFGKIKT